MAAIAAVRESERHLCVTLCRQLCVLLTMVWLLFHEGILHLTICLCKFHIHSLVMLPAPLVWPDQTTKSRSSEAAFLFWSFYLKGFGTIHTLINVNLNISLLVLTWLGSGSTTSQSSVRFPHDRGVKGLCLTDGRMRYNQLEKGPVLL